MSKTTTSKYQLVLADGTTKDYARKIDAVVAGNKTGQAYQVLSPNGTPVHVHELKPKAVKVTKPKADRVPAAERPGTFQVTGKDGETHKCVGACGKTLPVSKFPTITSRPGVRVAECRVDRDARTKAAKAAKAAQA